MYCRYDFRVWVGMLLLTLIALTVSAAPVAACGGGVLCVDADATGAATGLSWTDAYTNVQDALDYTAVHTPTTYEIWVAEGVYYPDEGGAHVANAVTETFRLAWNNVQLYGGFAATETLRTQRDGEAPPTILSGDIDANDWNTDTNAINEVYSDTVGANAWHVLYLDGVTNEAITETTVIDGFIITAGQANGSSSNSQGGGMINKAGCPTLTRLVFSGNYASDRGGGMYTYVPSGMNSPALAYVTFRGNYAVSGGGMFNDGNYGDSNPMLTHVVFSRNYANYGGGMYNYGNNGTSSPVLTNVVFSGNAADNGGGIHNNGANGVSSPRLTNVIFTGNYVSQQGGGMFNNSVNSGVSNPVLTNVTFSGNYAGAEGGGIYNIGTFGASYPVLVNCILWTNGAPYGPQIYNDGATPTLTYSDINVIKLRPDRFHLAPF